ncbi:MAG: hypothetical protein JWQ62_538 [Lacunisphaera sp.]|nr:hypothetical protein [Lacunisphaera sp.]
MPLSCALDPTYVFTPVRGLPYYFTSALNRVSDFIHERRYGIVTTGQGGPKVSEEVYPYGFVAYHTSFAVLDHVGLGASDVVVDLGAGKGRVVCAAATYRVKRVVGVEIDPVLAEAGRLNAAAMRGRRAPIEFQCMSATDYNYDDATVITLFNPFGAETMREVLARLEESWLRRPRNLRIIYCNPILSPLLSAKPWLEFHDCWTPRPWSRMKFPAHFYRSIPPGPASATAG